MISENDFFSLFKPHKMCENISSVDGLFSFDIFNVGSVKKERLHYVLDKLKRIIYNYYTNTCKTSTPTEICYYTKDLTEVCDTCDIIKGEDYIYKYDNIYFSIYVQKVNIDTVVSIDKKPQYKDMYYCGMIFNYKLINGQAS